ncbi:unnamed protein product [Orchesella dallaii]|uniref:Tyrosine decarboxylase n=1 Tax=Orchesella dallaii TaxID=48710 RepID=A0ABP1QXX4_9HEXA
MDASKFKRCGYELVDWSIKYMETLDDRKPLPDVQPGWLWNVVPKEAPEKGEPFERIMRDLEPVVLEGMAHWQHRQFFSYFPAGNAWSSIMGDIFSNATGVNGTNWGSCPVVTELEIIICDWCCKFLGLPKFFLSPFSCPESEGAGIIQHSASEAIFYSMMWAREDAVRKLRQKFPNKPRAILLNMLVAYCNNECHSCVERGSLMGAIRLRKLEPDNEGGIKADTLRNAIKQDMEQGLIPFYHCAIIGSTGITSADDLMEVGEICESYDMWLHCDAVRYKSKAVDPMTGWEEDVYKTPYPPDLKHYAVPATRRFRAYKLWCVIRNYGVEGIRRYCRNHINLAKLFEKYVKRDDRFEVCGPVRFGLVAFRLKGLNEATSRLLDALNFSRRIHMVPSHFHEKVVIRFALCAEYANENDIDVAWRIIDEFASVILRQYEKEMASDVAMKNLYNKQHHHDELAAIRKDPRIQQEEKEAEQTLEELKKRMQLKADGVIRGIDAVAVDGSWDHGDANVFKEFDKYLHEHPEETDDKIYHDPNFPGKVQSMLHIHQLEETVSHAPSIGGAPPAPDD